MSEPTRVIGGHKAAIANPRISEEAKEHSRQVIDELEADPETQATREKSNEGKNEGNVIGGHKAALKNPNISDEAKEHSKEVLEDMGAL